MPLLLDVEGATGDQLAWGIAAASVVFAFAGVTPNAAAAANFNRSGWDDDGFPEEGQLSDEELRAAAVWDRAEQAAIEACCAGWPEMPQGAYLVLEEEEGDHWRHLFTVRLMQLHGTGMAVTGDWNEIATALWPTHHHLPPGPTAEAYLRRAHGEE
jgi:hypothetical protein